MRETDGWLMSNSTQRVHRTSGDSTRESLCVWRGVSHGRPCSAVCADPLRFPHPASAPNRSGCQCVGYSDSRATAAGGRGIIGCLQWQADPPERAACKVCKPQASASLLAGGLGGCAVCVDCVPLPTARCLLRGAHGSRARRTACPSRASE